MIQTTDEKQGIAGRHADARRVAAWRKRSGASFCKKEDEMRKTEDRRTKTKKPKNGVAAPGKGGANRNYKDTLFRLLFKDRESLLCLYNALNGTSYTDAGGLEITTLENAVYMTYKNDVSFVFNYELMLYEHQSTANPNMPLRNLMYVSDVLGRWLEGRNLYGSRPVKIPAPRFVVFYNGREDLPDRSVLRLSDSYERAQEHPELELVVTVYNINWGHNREIMDTCEQLAGYARFVAKVREYGEEMPRKEAVGKAVEYCIGNGILEDFLKKHRAEAIEMWYDFDAERYLADEKKWSYEQGVEQGMERGRQQGVEQKTRTVIRNMLAQGMSDEDILSLVECTPDLIRRIRTETDENAVTVK